MSCTLSQLHACKENTNGLTISVDFDHYPTQNK